MRFALVFVLAASSYAANDYIGRLEYRFEQVKSGEKYIAGGPGYRVSLSRKEVALTLPSAEIHMHFEGSRGDTSLSAEEVLPGQTNHLEGTRPAQWRTGVSSYRKVRYREVYPGIDLLFYGSGKTLEYDYIVRPGGDPAAIRMRISGTANTRIDSRGRFSPGRRRRRGALEASRDLPAGQRWRTRRRPICVGPDGFGALPGGVLRSQPRTGDRPRARVLHVFGRHGQRCRPRHGDRWYRQRFRRRHYDHARSARDPCGSICLWWKYVLSDKRRCLRCQVQCYRGAWST